MVGMQVLVGGRRRLCAPEYQGHRPDCYQGRCGGGAMRERAVGPHRDKSQLCRAGGGCRDESTCVFFRPISLYLPCFTLHRLGIRIYSGGIHQRTRASFRYCVRISKSWMSRRRRHRSSGSLASTRTKSTMRASCLASSWTRSQRSRILYPFRLAYNRELSG